ncbi:MAG TPA: hypothetical protein VIR98_01515 [Candidatus Paceibacterota bacterium]|jgi:hypothetical protein
MRKSLYIVIIALVVGLAVEIALVVYYRQTRTILSTSKEAEYSLSYPRVLPANPNLSDAEKKVFLDQRTSTSSSAEVVQASRNIIEAAVPSSKITIADSCRPNPVVAHIPNEGSMTFFNDSSKDIVLLFMGKKYPIAAGRSVLMGPLSIPGNPERSAMTVSFRCDNVSSPAGFVYVSSMLK